MKIDNSSFSSQLQMLRGVEPIAPMKSNKIAEDGSGKQSFADMLTDQLKAVNQQGVEAEKSMQTALLGDEPNPHSTIIAVQKATISFQLMMSIKQRLEQAYQQIVRTQM